MADDLNTSLSQLLDIANKLFGTTAQNWDEIFDAILPAKYSLLRRLAVLYEREMLACRDAKAFFSACVMGAAMLEALLLLLCMMNHEQVENTMHYKSRTRNQQKNFEQILCCFGFEDLIEISAELDWVPTSLISNDWKTALPESYRDIARDLRPNMSKQHREAGASSLVVHPAYSLMLLLNTMRNRVHPGRWIRGKHQLSNDVAFSEWAQVALVAAAHIRDCLVSHHFKDLVALTKRCMMEKLPPELQ